MRNDDSYLMLTVLSVLTESPACNLKGFEKETLTSTEIREMLIGCKVSVASYLFQFEQTENGNPKSYSQKA